MEKVPFTAEGVARKQAELYALPQSELDVQADLILKQFKTWVTDNFSLTSKQDDYVKAMDAQSELYISDITSSSVRIKLPINVSIDPPPTDGDSSKLFKCSTTTEISIFHDVAAPITGSMVIHITWVRR